MSDVGRVHGTHEFPANTMSSGASGSSGQPDHRGEQPQRVYQVIPVGQEPPSLPPAGEAGDSGRGSSGEVGLVATAGSRPSAGRSKGGQASRVRNPEGLRTYKNALREQQEFVRLTMRDLTRAEISVWLAIHGCKGRDTARIGYAKIKEITGIKGQRHVTAAIRSLEKRGLLEVVRRGKYRPNSGDGAGMASEYRIYPTPDPRLLKAVQRDDADSNDGAGVAVDKPKPR